MNKTVKVILNILIVIAAIGLFLSLIVMGQSFRYANREVEDPNELSIEVFGYDVKDKSYGEVLESFYVKRLSSFEAPEGMEGLYHVAEYAHNAFMSRVYEEKGDEEMFRANAEKAEVLRQQLGDYAFTADEVDEMVRTAP